MAVRETIGMRARVEALLGGAPVGEAELKEILALLDRHYYTDDTPIVSDAAYDRLTDLWRHVTGQIYQELGDVSAELASVPHAYPILSLQKAYTLADVGAFLASGARALGCAVDDLVLVMEPKIDGLTLVLEYKNGQLVRALTRGNGRMGEDVTHNVRGLSGIPAAIPHTAGTVYVRGEAFLPLSAFAALKAAGADVATPRNTAAGDIRRKSTGGPSRARERGVCFLAYHSEGLGPEVAATQDEVRRVLADWGFLTTASLAVHGGPAAGETVDTPVSDLGRAIGELAGSLEAADFATDGLVLKINERAAQARLGATERTPRWAIAYKLLGDEYETTVRAIQWQVGRVGAVTPVLICDPIDMEGAIIRNYTAHHAQFLQELGADVGSRIVVTRAGDVIPKVLRLADGQARVDTLVLPAQCPSCSAALSLRNGKVLECHNAACGPKLRKAISYFAARDNMDIAGLGEEVVDALVVSGCVASPADLYGLTTETLAALPLANGQLYGTVRGEKLIQQIAASARKPFATVLHALGAPGVGYPECRSIAAEYGLVDLLAQATSGDLEERLTAIHGVGPATAAALQAFLRDNHAWITQLLQYGVQVQPQAPVAAPDGPLRGQTFVVTGTLEMGSREQVEALIRAAGGTTADSVSAKTSYLVAGTKPGGSKMKATRKHGTPVLGEADLARLLNG